MYIRSAIGVSEWSNGEQETLVELIQRMIKELYEQGQIFQGIRIGDLVIREGVEDFIEKQTETIHNQEIVIESMDETVLMNDIYSDMTAYLPKLINGVDSISELLYGQMTNEEWSYFSQLIEGIHWFMSAAHGLRHHIERLRPKSSLLDALVKFESEAEGHVAELNEALTQSDYTSAADQLKYEWSEMLLALQEAFNDGGAL